MDTLDIRPKARNRWLIGLGCAGFTLAGLAMLLVGEGLGTKAAGLLSIVFFGVFGTRALIKSGKRPVTLRLTPTELQQVYPEGLTHVPWSDVEDVGLVTVESTPMVGLRLRSLDNYLSTMSPEVERWISRELRLLRPVSHTTSMIQQGGGHDVSMSSTHQNVDARHATGSLGEIDSMRAALAWSRQQFGYDLTLGWHELDRPAAEFVELINGYRGRAGQAWPPS